MMIHLGTAGQTSHQNDVARHKNQKRKSHPNHTIKSSDEHPEPQFKVTLTHNEAAVAGKQEPETC